MSSISSISSNASIGSSQSSAATISQLEKQKADLDKQIADEQASKDDDKVKQLKLAQLKEQEQAVDAEIQAAKAAKSNAGKRSVQKTAASIDITSLAEDSVSNAKGLNKIV